MKDKFTNKLLNLETEIEQAFKWFATHKGVESKEYSCNVIPIKRDNLQFNLDGGRYLTEVSANNLIDNEGYQYNFSVLNTSQLCELADYVTSFK